MPHGFFTIEQWKRPTRGAPPEWVAVDHLAGDQSLTSAIKQLEAQGNPGLFRVVQTQRMIWAEKDGDQLRLRAWHAMTPEDLARTAEAFERDGGHYQVQRARAEQKGSQTRRKKTKR